MPHKGEIHHQTFQLKLAPSDVTKIAAGLLNAAETHRDLLIFALELQIKGPAQFLCARIHGSRTNWVILLCKETISFVLVQNHECWNFNKRSVKLSFWQHVGKSFDLHISGKTLRLSMQGSKGGNPVAKFTGSSALCCNPNFQCNGLDWSKFHSDAASVQWPLRKRISGWHT